MKRIQNQRQAQCSKGGISSQLENYGSWEHWWGNQQTGGKNGIRFLHLHLHQGEFKIREVIQREKENRIRDENINNM